MGRGAARPNRRSIPDTPGSYQFKDAAGPGDLRRQGEEPPQPAVELLRAARARCPSAPARWCTAAETVEWIEVRNEVEALFLEFNLIKQHQPRFNIRLKDDKSYPYLAVTLDEEWPRAMVMRGAKRKGVRYFGPYAHAYAIRETLDLLLRTFPIRTCTNGKFDRHHRLGRPCLYAHIEKCAAPCVGDGRPRRVRRARRTSCSTFLDGDTTPVLDRLEQADARGGRRSSSSSGRPGCATSSCRCARRSSASRWSAPREEDFDVIGIVDDALEATVQVFFVRKGRVVGRKGLSSTRSRTSTRPALVGRAARAALRRRDARRRAHARSSSRSSPRTTSSTRSSSRSNRGSQGPHPRAAARREARAARRPSTQNAQRGVRAPQAAARVRPQRPRPGARSRCRRRSTCPKRRCASSASTSRTCRAPRSSASMVVMEDGLPKRSDYRRFKIRAPGRARTTSRRWRRC